ncbi:HAMP domain-containing protein [Candidatus Woesearchaeota archaeon]|nr:HAMP domain-containing protein [Candidatus Woesearchaeota archaeon]
MKIGTKLLIFFSVIAIIAVLFTSIVLFFTASNAMQERAIAQLESIVVLKESHLTSFIEEEIGDLESIALDDLFVNEYKIMLDDHLIHQYEKTQLHNEFRKRLNVKLTTMGQDFIELYIINFDGHVHISTDQNQEGKIKTKDEYFIKGLTQSFVQKFHYSLTLRQPAITIATPIKDSKNNVIAVLAGNVNLREINNLMQERHGLGETGETYLVNSFNYMITDSRFEKGYALKKTIYTEGVKDCLNKNNGFGVYDNYRDNVVIGVYKWLSEHNVCLIAEIDQEEALRPVKDLRNTIIILNFVIMSLIIFFGYMFSKTITNPILELTNAADQIAKDDFDINIKAQSNDELGKLSRSFNTMANDLQKSKLNLEEIVRDRTKELTKKITQLEKFHKYVVDRELKMLEQKKKIKELTSQLKKENDKKKKNTI